MTLKGSNNAKDILNEALELNPTHVVVLAVAPNGLSVTWSSMPLENVLLLQKHLELAITETMKRQTGGGSLEIR